jgi:subtilisin family serine protease
MSAIRLLFVAVALAGAVLAAPAQEKKKVEKAADLPRYSYAIDGSVEDTIRDPAKFAAFAREYRRNTETTLATYDVQDKATLRQLIGSLAQLDLLEGHDDAALAGFARVKALQDKPADKLLSGLQSEAVIAATRQAPDRASEAYRRAVGERIAATLESLPYAVVQNDVREMKAGNEIASESLAFGYVREVLQPIVTRAGTLSSEFAPTLINVRYRLLVSLPLKTTLVATYADYLARHTVVKQDIWATRNVDLPVGGAYTPVVVAVWDSGVDTSLFKTQLALSNGAPALIAFDKFSRPTSGTLYPLPADVKTRLPLMKARAKGFSDLQSNIDSAEASEVKQYLSALKPAEYKTAVEELRMMGNYLHGTHVAGITLAGNPYARLVTARIEFGHTLVPDPCPSREQAVRDAEASQAYVDFMKKNGVRVVNMSWGGDVAGVESDLEVCGIGKTTEERQKIAREYFDIVSNALKKAFASAPGILFVAAAGNENADSSFAESIPADIALPNVLAVGAVDLAGDEASFTSYGPTVKVHANGYQVESTIPGGERIAESGTSMAAPQVTNLAAKMLAVDPKLTPTELVAIIVSTANRTADGRRVLVNPAQAIAAVRTRKAA